MSDAVWLALIGLANNIVSNAAPILATILGICTLVFQIWSKLDARKGREELKATVCQQAATVVTKVDDVQQAATRSQHEVTQSFVAGERRGVVIGIEVGKKQATDFGGLNGRPTDYGGLPP